MWKNFKLLGILFLSGCTYGTGSFTGKVIDVTWEGVIWKTCEVDVQYGDGSSKHVRYTSMDQKTCDDLQVLNGKPVHFEYEQTFAKCFTCGSSDLIRSFKKIE